MSGAEAGPRRVVVVGASLAGLRTVEALRSGGYDGELVLVGSEPHLPYDRPPLSKEVLAGQVPPDRTLLRDAEDYGALDVDLRLGTTAVDLDLADRELIVHGGESLTFDRVVIATGARPRHLPGTPELDGVHVLRTLDDSIAVGTALRDQPRVVVVGAGFIGSEVAATARGMGCDVTVLEGLPVPLSRALGEEMGRVCGQLHVEEGVDLRCGVAVAGFEGDGRVDGVRLADGEVVPADLVVVGIGVVPATGWLESSGLELNDGIVCDETCRASSPDVYAAGDVARWMNPLFGEHMRVEHWSNAVEQAGAVAANLVAGPDGAQPYAPVPYFWSDQYGVKIQFVGHAGGGDEVRVVHGSPEERKFVALYGRGGRLRGALGFASARLVMRYRALIANGASWDDALEHAAAT